MICCVVQISNWENIGKQTDERTKKANIGKQTDERIKKANKALFYPFNQWINEDFE